MPLGMEVGLGPGHIVLDGDPAPPMGHSPPFSAHVCCDQMAGWSKMPRSRDVYFCPDDIVLDGDPAPPKVHSPPPNFWPISVVAKGLDGSRCHLVRGMPRPRPHCVRWGPSSPQGAQPRSNFWCMSVVAIQVDGLPLGVGIGPGPGQIVLDGDPAPPK